MSNVFREALTSCNTSTYNGDTHKIIEFFSSFIKQYGIFLRENQTISFKFRITSSSQGAYRVILAPPDGRYGTFCVEFDGTPFGELALVNLLRNNGAKVTYDANSSENDAYDHYLVEFALN